MKKMLYLFSLTFCSLIYSQERDQFVKWGSSLYYTFSLQKELENSINPGIFCDVALGENDVHDSAPIYFGITLDYAIRSKNEVNSISAGSNIKKYLSPGNTKTSVYLVAGGKITFLKIYERYLSDYSLNAGIGLSVNSFLEINSFYTYGLTNSYLNSDREFVKAKTLSFGVKFFFQKKWWY